MHKIHSTADGIDGFVELDFADGDGIDQAKPPAGRLSLPVRRLTSGNSLEDRELQKFVDVARYPTIDGVLTAMERVEGDPLPRLAETWRCAACRGRARTS